MIYIIGSVYLKKKIFLNSFFFGETINFKIIGKIFIQCISKLTVKKLAKHR